SFCVSNGTTSTRTRVGSSSTRMRGWWRGSSRFGSVRAPASWAVSGLGRLGLLGDQRQERRVLLRGQRDLSLDLRHALDPEGSGLEEVGERGGIRGLDLQPVRVLAGEVVALLDGQEFFEVVDESLLEPGMLQADVDVGRQGKAHLLVIEQRDEAADHP